jgi:hypothetical protein
MENNSTSDACLYVFSPASKFLKSPYAEQSKPAASRFSWATSKQWLRRYDATLDFGKRSECRPVSIFAGNSLPWVKLR